MDNQSISTNGNTKERLLSAMRPTGPFHIRHWMVLNQWKKYQQRFWCFFGIYDDTNSVMIVDYTIDLIKNWFICGINLEENIIFVQSLVPEHSQLFVLLCRIAPLHLLKDGCVYQKKEAVREQINLGILTYPLHELTDAQLYKTPWVSTSIPGDIELGCRILKKIYEAPQFKSKFLIFPKVVDPPMPFIPRFATRHSYKVRKNLIYPTDPKEIIEQKIKHTPSDLTKHGTDRASEPIFCPVFEYYKIPELNHLAAEIESQCRRGCLHCKDCKNTLSSLLWTTFQDFRGKAQAFNLTRSQLVDLLHAGSQKARQIALQSLGEWQTICKMTF